MLLADLRARGRGEGAPVRIPIGLVERDPPVAVGVSRAAQGRHEVVGEVRRLQLVGLLAELLRRARCHDREPLLRQSRHRVVAEVRRGLGPLHAGEGAALAGVEDDDGEGRRERAQALAERAEGDLLAAEGQGVRARVARVVEEDLGLLAVRCVRPDLRGKIVDRPADVRGVRMEEDVDVGRVVVSEVPKNVGDTTRIVFREAERRLPRATRVASDDDGVGVRAGGGCRRTVRARRTRQAGGPQDGEEGGNGRAHEAYRSAFKVLTRRPLEMGTPLPLQRFTPSPR